MKHWLTKWWLMWLLLIPTSFTVGQITVKEEASTPVYSKRQYDELKEQAIRGDTYAYDQYYCFGHYGDENCLALSIIMAEKYGHPRAFFDVYYILTTLYSNNTMSIDSTTASYAISFLKKGAELSNSNCCFELCRLYLYGEYVEQDTNVAKQYLFKMNFDDEESANKSWINRKRRYYKDIDINKSCDIKKRENECVLDNE